MLACYRTLSLSPYSWYANSETTARHWQGKHTPGRRKKRSPRKLKAWKWSSLSICQSLEVKDIPKQSSVWVCSKNFPALENLCKVYGKSLLHLLLPLPPKIISNSQAKRREAKKPPRNSSRLAELLSMLRIFGGWICHRLWSSEAFPSVPMPCIANILFRD